MTEHNAENVAPCSECGRPLPEFRVGQFVEVKLVGKWLPGLILTRSRDTFSIAVAGHSGPLAFGDPEVIPHADEFLRPLRVIPPGEDR